MRVSRSVLGIALVLIGFAAGASWSGLLAKQTGGQYSAATREVTPRGNLTPEEISLTKLFEQSSPSVVYITSIAMRRDFFRLNVMEIPQGTGSGFVWDESGHVVTNYHVIRDADKTQVTLADQSTWDAEIVGAAPEKDLAVLRINAPREVLQPIRVGSSHDLKVGQTVLAIGNPFGFDQTLTTGIISAVGREIESIARIPIRDVIQTDAAINPGNSGGPLLDSVGRLIGVNTLIYTPSGASAGIGFAIPVDTVNWVVPDLITFGRVRRPTLGVELLSDQLARRYRIEGALVLEVVSGGGAEKAGLRSTSRDRRGRVRLGDIIVAINDERVRSAAELGLALERLQAGETVRVTVLRDQREAEFSVVLSEKR